MPLERRIRCHPSSSSIGKFVMSPIHAKAWLNARLPSACVRIPTPLFSLSRRPTCTAMRVWMYSRGRRLFLSHLKSRLLTHSVLPVNRHQAIQEPDNLAPLPDNGTNYLRVNRGPSLAFGVAILRSPVFTISPGDDNTFTFSFWIQSKWPKFTNLELYLGKNGNEGLLLKLYNYSDVSNQIWRSQTVSITDDSFSNLTLVFYAYCGTDAVDAVAIDDLRFTTSSRSTTSTTTEEPTTITTEEPTTITTEEPTTITTEGTTTITTITTEKPTTITTEKPTTTTEKATTITTEKPTTITTEEPTTITTAEEPTTITTEEPTTITTEEPTTITTEGTTEEPTTITTEGTTAITTEEPTTITTEGTTTITTEGTTEVTTNPSSSTSFFMQLFRVYRA